MGNSSKILVRICAFLLGFLVSSEGAVPPSYFTSTRQPSQDIQQKPDVLVQRCLKPRGQFPGGSCNKYVNCWDGTVIEQFCPDGLVFNPKGYCDFQYNVNCEGKPIELNTATPPSNHIPTDTPTAATPPTVIVTLPTVDLMLKKFCLKPRGQFRSQSCSKFVNCWDDVVVEQECPEGLFFSSKGYCDYPANVDCQDSTIPIQIIPESDQECSQAFGTFRDKNNCSNYFTCVRGKIVARYSCPEGFRFNSNLGVCDYVERVDCSLEGSQFNPKHNFLENIPKEFMQQIDSCTPGSVLRLNPQCTAACICHDGLSEVVQCPAGLSYDSQTDKCLLPHLAKC